MFTRKCKLLVVIIIMLNCIIYNSDYATTGRPVEHVSMFSKSSSIHGLVLSLCLVYKNKLVVVVVLILLLPLLLLLVALLREPWGVITTLDYDAESQETLSE